MATEEQGRFWQVYEQYKQGLISRREFIQKSSQTGVGLPIILFVLNATKVETTPAPADTPPCTDVTLNQESVSS